MEEPTGDPDARANAHETLADVASLHVHGAVLNLLREDSRARQVFIEALGDALEGSIKKFPMAAGQGVAPPTWACRVAAARTLDRLLSCIAITGAELQELADA